MAKISDEERHQYFEKIKPYKSVIDAILKREKTIVSLLQKEPETASFKRLSLADEMLNLSSNYIILNGISQSMLKVKNEDALNDGRKSLYKCVIYLEELVTNYVDAPFVEYEEKLEAIASVSAADRYQLVRKLGLAIELLELSYGENTKWRWSFVELEGRYTTVSKNIIDLKNAVANMDPRSPDYEPTVYHMRLIKKLLMQAADRYREKYELSTNRFDDFKMGISFLGALRRLHAVMGDRAEGEEVKKKMEIWSSKLDADIKKKEEAAKRK